MNENLTYKDKLLIANEYLADFIIDWEDLSDVNSLHDCDTIEDIRDACKERLLESGFDDFED
jgi:hypothetical protein